MKSPLTTLCYIEKDNCYLMLHRIKKQNDINKDKWIGVGGHFEWGESPEDCVIREVKEETGLTLNSARFCGLITFISDDKDCEYMALFHSNDFTGSLIDCDEGSLEWVPIEKVNGLPAWEGDKIFLKLMQDKVPFFSLKLVYKDGKLIQKVLDGKNF